MKSQNALRADRSGVTEEYREDGADAGRSVDAAHKQADRRDRDRAAGRTAL